MLLLLMTIAQPAAAISQTEPLRLTETPCKPGADRGSGDIVVCAKPSQTYRIAPVKPAGPALPPAAIKLSSNVAAKIRVEQQDVGGFPSNRVMLSFKIRF
jgi:hypothetical protein